MKRRDFIRKTSILSLATMSASQTLASLSSSLPDRETMMPVLFIGHGSPMNGIENNEFSAYWRQLGKEIQPPSAVLCISAHWLTKGTAITAMEAPRTIHDFGNFARELYEVQYPVNGSPELASNVKEHLKAEVSVELDHDWGLDHGCWTVVRQMYPEADIPVLQLSIDYHKPPQYHYDLGKQLSYLRKKGVLILGSGNMIHNLRKIGAPNGQPLTPEFGTLSYGYDWALSLNETFKSLISRKQHKKLIEYHNLGEAARLAIPTPDHYYPMLYTLALQEDSEEVEVFNDKCIAGSLSMTSFKIS